MPNVYVQCGSRWFIIEPRNWLVAFAAGLVLGLVAGFVGASMMP